MVSNVLLVNLLIAMMGDTYAHPNPNPNPNTNTNLTLTLTRYARIKENADTEWKVRLVRVRVT